MTESNPRHTGMELRTSKWSGDGMLLLLLSTPRTHAAARSAGTGSSAEISSEPPLPPPPPSLRSVRTSLTCRARSRRGSASSGAGSSGSVIVPIGLSVAHCDMRAHAAGPTATTCTPPAQHDSGSGRAHPLTGADRPQDGVEGCRHAHQQRHLLQPSLVTLPGWESPLRADPSLVTSG